jgi:patatin-like phospholipase/acyl hydrolase
MHYADECGLGCEYLLTLKSGGIRGIVELEVLYAIQKSLGEGIPIRALFDLIVGTR